MPQIDSYRIHRDAERRPLGGGETMLRAEPDARHGDGRVDEGGTHTFADRID